MPPTSSPPPHWEFDIDRYLNRLIPPPAWQRVPYPIAHFLGYRKETPREHGNLLTILCAFIGVFCSLLLIQLLSHQIPDIATNGPSIVASLGAAAVLEFYTIDSPLAQPRNFFLSQIIASVVGTSCCKLFQLSPEFEAVRWVGGALACASATALMGLTKTVHPPAGATALLAVVNDETVRLGWGLIPLMMLSCAIMLLTALLLNNVARRYPVYWWTADDLAGRGSGDGTGRRTSSVDEEKAKCQHAELVVTRGAVVVPEHVTLSEEERLVLDRLGARI